MSKPPAKVLPFKGDLLEQGERHATELSAAVTTDGQSATGEASVKAGGDSWWLRFVAKLRVAHDQKPDVQAGVEFQKRWFGGW